MICVHWTKHVLAMARQHALHSLVHVLPHPLPSVLCVLLFTHTCYSHACAANTCQCAATVGQVPFTTGCTSVVTATLEGNTLGPYDILIDICGALPVLLEDGA